MGDGFLTEQLYPCGLGENPWVLQVPTWYATPLLKRGLPISITALIWLMAAALKAGVVVE